MITGGDARRRLFDGVLGEILDARDQTCREPFCGAPIRHRDHITRWADGGLTTLRSGRGLCEFHNHVREQPGYCVTGVGDGIITTSTPTGHTYHSRPPPPP